MAMAMAMEVVVAEEAAMAVDAVSGIDDATFQVTVSFISGDSFEIICDSGQDTPVEEIKKELAKQTGLNWFGQRLLYEDKELLNNETLGMAGVKRNAGLTLVRDDDQADSSDDEPPALVDSSDDEPPAIVDSTDSDDWFDSSDDGDE